MRLMVAGLVVFSGVVTATPAFAQGAPATGTDVYHVQSTSKLPSGLGNAIRKATTGITW